MRRLALFPALTLLVAAGGCNRQEPKEPQPAAAAAEPAAPEEAGTVDTANAGKAAPKATFADMAGAPVTLEAFKGRPVLVNLWATWCVPCIKELPQLDAIAAGGLTVLAVSEDLEGAGAVKPFLAKRGFKALKPHLDKSNALLLGLKEGGLPVTVLYGADGKEIWRVRGGMDWTSARAKALLAQAGA